MAGGGEVAAPTERVGPQGRYDAGGGEGSFARRGEPVGARPAVAWGDYEPAIRRHELSLGRPHPHPVDDKGRLDPWFVEWMQMIPEGWVCDLLTEHRRPREGELSRAQVLKILGNGVVPPQAAYALSILRDRFEREVAA